MLKNRPLIVFDTSRSRYTGKLTVEEMVEKLEGKKKEKVFEEVVVLEEENEEVLYSNRHQLEEASLLCLLAVKPDQYSLGEIDLIESYVSEGGKLLVTADPPFESPNNLIEKFGLKFSQTKIEDESNHDGRHSDHIIARDLMEHLINEGIEAISLGDYGGYPIEASNSEALVLAKSSEDSNPPNSAISVLAPYKKGEVLALGQTVMLQNRFLDRHDNQKFLENVLNFFTREEAEITSETEETPKSSINFCTNCGAKLQPGDIFCGNCGKRVKATEKPRQQPETARLRGLKNLIDKASEKTASLKDEIVKNIQEMEEKTDDVISQRTRETSLRGEDGSKESEWISGTSEIESFSNVLGGVLEAHLEALSDLTNSITPWMISHNCIEGKRLQLDWGNECQATMKNLLMLLTHVNIGLNNIANFGEVKKEARITVEEMTEIRNNLNRTREKYYGSKASLDALQEASKPLSDFLINLGELAQEDDVTNVRKLKRFERVAHNLMRKISETDWSQHPKTDPDPWVDEAFQYSMHVIGMDVKTSSYHVLYQYPAIDALGFEADIMRYVVPFFFYKDTIDKAYTDCLRLFEECEKESGFLRNPPAELVEKTIAALSEFNTQYHGLYSAYSYVDKSARALGSGSYNLEERVEGINKEIEKALRDSGSRSYVIDPSKVIEMIYDLALFLNEVEPVSKSKSHYPW